MQHRLAVANAQAESERDEIPIYTMGIYCLRIQIDRISNQNISVEQSPLVIYIQKVPTKRLITLS